MFKCFEPEFSTIDLDKTPKKFKHKLMGHPTLSIDNLAKAIPEMPEYQVMYSKGLNDLGINFDRAHIDHKNGLGLRETIETIATSNSYIAVKNPETHPSFKELFSDLANDMSELIKLKGKGIVAKEPMLWMFIASPNAQTPFHFDRYSNFIMQFRGSKEIAVFPPLNEKVISVEDYEAYMDRQDSKPLWREELDQYGEKFNFTPGEALHIPFTSGHYVKNGPEDVSISLSMFFHSDETIRRTNAMRINHRLRRRLNKIGLNVTPAGRSDRLDAFKSSMLPAADRIGNMLGRLKNLK